MSIVNEPTDDWITGSHPYNTALGTLASGTNVAARVPLGQVSATGKFVPWDPAAEDGSQVAVRLSLYPVEAGAGDAEAQMITGGSFNPDLVAWPAGTTSAQKLAAFAGTPIVLQKPV
ncbi:head decoration protein [Stutzerimonas nosocomialis]|uniref:Head decoration protein n=1 Tax=Stutzerimonas nosocomialis TaxID=1056496 RepID=A0A5R9QIJ8_9GAMM|nr:head decoration protein [Stutzerimonas nosocomialis]TLX65077.1 head decoration protein [Stutzerimonas nosocomialis]